MKKVWLRLIVAGLILMLTGCASMAPPQPPSLDLPKPPSDLRTVRKGSKVHLSWTIPTTTTDRKTIQEAGVTRICRGVDVHLTECGTPVGSAPAPSTLVTSGKNGKKNARTDTYTDSLPDNILSENPAGFVTYTIEVLNSEGRGAGLSNQVRVSTIRTLPPPENFRAQVTGQGVVLSWKNALSPPASMSVHFAVRVYRRPEGSSESTLIGSVPVTGGDDLSLTDSNIEWEKTYEYRADTVTVIAETDKPELQIEGDDTPEVKIFAHDIFPPAVPAGLQAVFSGPGQQPFVDLIWAPVSDVDLEGYNVYRHEEGTAPVKLNAAPLKVPAYRDIAVVSGHTYFYSVSAVDVRANESARSEEASESVP